MFCLNYLQQIGSIFEQEQPFIFFSFDFHYLEDMAVLNWLHLYNCFVGPYFFVEPYCFGPYCFVGDCCSRCTYKCYYTFSNLFGTKICLLFRSFYWQCPNSLNIVRYTFATSANNWNAFGFSNLLSIFKENKLKRNITGTRGHFKWWKSIIFPNC